MAKPDLNQRLLALQLDMEVHSYMFNRFDNLLVRVPLMNGYVAEVLLDGKTYRFHSASVSLLDTTDYGNINGIGMLYELVTK